MAKQQFSVGVFSKIESINIGVQPAKNSSCIIASQIYKAVQRELNLRNESLGIFGLYVGPLGFPKRLLVKEEVIPVEDYLHLCFQRFSFDAEQERKITACDVVALDLIFCELKFVLCQDRIWPLPSLLQLIELAQLLKVESPNSDSDTIDRKKQIVEKVRSLSLFYWSRYYLVRECGISLSLASLLELGTDVFVALEFDKLVLIDSETSTTLSWCWSAVKDVCLQKDRKNTFVANVLVSKDGLRMLRKISVDTVRSEYLFSVAIHILRLHERKSKDVPLHINWLGSFYTYPNPIFINQGF